MKLTGPACTEAMSEAEEARRRERAEDSAGGVRVERRVRCVCQTDSIGAIRLIVITKICCPPKEDVESSRYRPGNSPANPAGPFGVPTNAQ